MKKYLLFICVLVFSVILLMGVCHTQDLVCPNGRVIEKDYYYETFVTEDFPEELLGIFCFTPCKDIPVLIMTDYPQIVVGMATESGYFDPNKPYITWFFDTSIEKYIIFIASDKDKDDILWISKSAPDGLEEFLQSIIRKPDTLSL